jgi:hypothetical protein
MVLAWHDTCAVPCRGKQHSMRFNFEVMVVRMQLERKQISHAGSHRYHSTQVGKDNMTPPAAGQAHTSAVASV